MPSEQSMPPAGVAAFTCRLDGVVVAWSRDAERMFAVDAEEAVGGRCHEMVGGRDVFGNPFCSDRCPCRQTAARGQAIDPFLLEIRNGRSHPFLVRATILVADGDGGEKELMHLLEPMKPRSPVSEDPVAGRELRTSAPPPRLHRRP